ncbi:MAG: hypothetical protein MJ097_00515 [Dorea sp.]|nr:hypothetical protein [Dorea sp.]
MSKISKEEQARLSGIQYALKICNDAKKNGADPMEALEKEVKFRCTYNVPIKVSEKALDELTASVKNHMYDTMKIIIGLLLHNELGFGKTRLERFWERFESQCECVYKGYVTFEDMAAALEDEAKVKLDPIRANNKWIHV